MALSLFSFHEHGSRVTMNHSSEFMTTGEAASLLRASPDMMRALHRSGQLPAQLTVTGRRLFRRADVERLAAQRAKANRKRARRKRK